MAMLLRFKLLLLSTNLKELSNLTRISRSTLLMSSKMGVNMKDTSSRGNVKAGGSTRTKKEGAMRESGKTI